MRSFRKYAALALCLALQGSVAVAATGDEKPATEKSAKVDKQEKSADDKKKKKKGKDEEEESEGESQKRMNLPIEKDHDSFGLKIPFENEQGVLQMMFKIGRASRLDEDRVKMLETEVETFDDAGNREMTIDLPESVLNLNTRVISADSPVTIRRSDFEITGRSMNFDTKTKRGTLAGDVRMLIFGRLEETISAEPKKQESIQ